jgi:hypothetical protein
MMSMQVDAEMLSLKTNADREAKHAGISVDRVLMPTQ